MATVDPSSPPASAADGSRPVVLVAAATARAAERATRHAAHLFGDAHAVESVVVDDPAAVVDDMARERTAAAVVLGVDLTDEDAAGRSTLLLIRSSACPVVVVAV